MGVLICLAIELENRIAEQKNLRAHNNAENARLIQKRNELEVREGAIKIQEAVLMIQTPESIGEPANLPDAFNCPLLRPDGSICSSRIEITACGTQIKAHYQHNCVPGVESCGGIPVQNKDPIKAAFDTRELLRLFPAMKESSDRLQREADRIRKLRNSNANQEEPTNTAKEDPNDGTPTKDPTTGTVTPEIFNPPLPPTTGPKSPSKSPPENPSNANKEAGSQQHDPAASDDDDPNKSPTTATGFDRRRKAAPSARKASAKTPAGSKRKKPMIEDEDNAVGGYPDLMAAKTPRGGKRQKTMMARPSSLGHESSVLGSGSGEEEPLIPPVGVRRTTRATSGTPGPSLAPPVARRAGRRKGRAEDAQLDEADEEEVEVMKSPAKRGRPQSPRKR